MAEPFLKAEWRKLVLVNYEVDPEVLNKYLPYGTEIDLWKNKCYVSLVGFMFLNTTVKGMKLPGHINFEEVNLRFYVRHTAQSEIKRGVVFMKEIVPKPIITWVANKIYKEHYQTLPMQHEWNEDVDNLKVRYTWFTDNRENSIMVDAENELTGFSQNSEEDFITEHYWGYTKINNQATSEYEVKHPSWKVYKVKKAVVNVDFGMTYGDDFEFLNHKKPISVMLAEGSEISVGNKRIIS